MGAMTPYPQLSLGPARDSAYPQAFDPLKPARVGPSSMRQTLGVRTARAD